MPSSSDQQLPNVTEGLSYSNFTPATPPPQYPIAQPEAQIAPSNCFWPSHVQIQPTHSARPPFHAQPPNQYDPDLIAFITPEHPPVGRSVKEHYEIRKDHDHGSYSTEAVSWQLPTAPASCTSGFMSQTIFTACQNSNEAANCPSECPNSESTRIFQPAFPMRSDM